jgi:hypothetical protein
MAFELLPDISHTLSSILQLIQYLLAELHTASNHEGFTLRVQLLLTEKICSNSVFANRNHNTLPSIQAIAKVPKF